MNTYLSSQIREFITFFTLYLGLHLIRYLSKSKYFLRETYFQTISCAPFPQCMTCTPFSFTNFGMQLPSGCYLNLCGPFSSLFAILKHFHSSVSFPLWSHIPLQVLPQFGQCTHFLFLPLVSAYLCSAQHFLCASVILFSELTSQLLLNSLPFQEESLS